MCIYLIHKGLVFSFDFVPVQGLSMGVLGGLVFQGVT